LKTDYL